MAHQIIVGPLNQGLRSDRTAFVIDNDSFPTLLNAYHWRGRIKRKRGTELITRLERYFNSSSLSYSSVATVALAGGTVNLFTGFSLASTGSILPTTVTIVDTTDGNKTYTDDGVGNLTATGGTGTINYATGQITITGGATHAISAVFYYYPGLPVMGLESLTAFDTYFPGNIGFDTVYSYNISTTAPFPSSDVSFYKNPASPNTAKTSVTPVTWNGANYQQFYTINYQGALWAINGFTRPFNTSNIGMQYIAFSTVTTSMPGGVATAVFTVATNPKLVIGDYVFINQVTDATLGPEINFQTGYVTATATGPFTVTVVFPSPCTFTASTYASPGIIQYLTNRYDNTKDCIRWYDGNPSNGANPPVLNTGLGWVNFCPPISFSNLSIDDAPATQYYLVGAQVMYPFKDRLVFFGPVIQTAKAANTTADSSQIYLKDTVIYSQNGTVYYTSTYTGDILSSTTQFTPVLVPVNQTATSPSWFEDVAGFGGFQVIGIDQPIISVSSNEDVLILGCQNSQVRMIYTGNDIIPFNFFIINSELGTSSTFSTVNLDQGVIAVGQNGITLTGQTTCERIDLAIPDNIFQFSLVQNGSQRICTQRDFENEWIYITYRPQTSDSTIYLYPTQTLLYNYREASWGMFNETYTTYGQFVQQGSKAWTEYKDITWEGWHETWNQNDAFQPTVIAGNQQGFVLRRNDDDTAEDTSLAITNIVVTTTITITAYNHCLELGDFVLITGCIGTIDTSINGYVYEVITVTSINVFVLGLTGTNVLPSGTYVGGGLITRFYIPLIQTKQFPTAWSMARKTRIGAQQYLFTNSGGAQIELQIYLSQNGSSPYNAGPIVPYDNVDNSSLVYTDVLFTGPELN
ncbi:MAG: hypothetical protein KGI54_09415, partial [Pseudomonadota bacterium]|nr:hypothetical protein [Pseudomonadota bacterium]